MKVLVTCRGVEPPQVERGGEMASFVGSTVVKWK